MNSDSENAIIKNENIIVSNRFEILDIEKPKNSIIDANIKSDVLVNVFAEIEDCSYWKNGADRDNIVLYSVNGINEGNLRVGDPSEKTAQQIELYKTDYLCLIFINREFPKNGNINLQYKEVDINRWNVV